MQKTELATSILSFAQERLAGDIPHSVCTWVQNHPDSWIGLVKRFTESEQGMVEATADYREYPFYPHPNPSVLDGEWPVTFHDVSSMLERRTIDPDEYQVTDRLVRDVVARFLHAMDRDTNVSPEVQVVDYLVRFGRLLHEEMYNSAYAADAYERGVYYMSTMQGESLFTLALRKRKQYEYEHDPIGYINFLMSSHLKATEVTHQLELIERPILVDIHGVLMDNATGKRANPMASEALRRFRDLGTVCFVSAGSPWTMLKEYFDGVGLWHTDMILLAKPNYLLNDTQAGQRAIDRYLSNHSHIDRLLIQYNTSWDFKRVAPLFNKPFDIPLIDDVADATENNPGIMGICVQEWTEPKRNTHLPTLLQAVDQVEAYYRTI